MDKYKFFFENYDITKEGIIINLKTKKEYKGKKDNRGYLTFHTTINKKCYHWGIHKLLALKYIPNPENYPVINHIDGNKLNNSLDNLEWCTIGYNLKHAYKLGLKKPYNKYEVC